MPEIREILTIRKYFKLSEKFSTIFAANVGAAGTVGCHLERNEVKSRDLHTLTTFQVNAVRRSLDSRGSLGMTALDHSCSPETGNILKFTKKVARGKFVVYNYRVILRARPD